MCLLSMVFISDFILKVFGQEDPNASIYDMYDWTGDVSETSDYSYSLHLNYI